MMKRLTVRRNIILISMFFIVYMFSFKGRTQNIENEVIEIDDKSDDDEMDVEVNSEDSFVEQEMQNILNESFSDEDL